MKVRHMRLSLGLFFLVAGLLLVALMLFKPEAAGKLNSPTRLGIAAFFAFVLAGVNLVKWYAGWMAFHQSATPVRQPLQPDPDAPRSVEPNTELDFSKKEEDRRDNL